MIEKMRKEIIYKMNKLIKGEAERKKEESKGEEVRKGLEERREKKLPPRGILFNFMCIPWRNLWIRVLKRKTNGRKEKKR